MVVGNTNLIRSSSNDIGMEMHIHKPNITFTGIFSSILSLIMLVMIELIEGILKLSWSSEKDKISSRKKSL